MDNFTDKISNQPMLKMEKNYLCKDCGKSYMTAAKLLDHGKYHRQDEVSDCHSSSKLSLQTIKEKHMLSS